MVSRPFLFSDDPSPLQDDDTLLVRIPSGLADKDSLLACYSNGLRFPQYFGGNWDALADCLRDLSWIRESGVLIVHRDILLKGSMADQEIYLDILSIAVEDWEADHVRVFKVMFPTGVRDAIQSILRP